DCSDAVVIPSTAWDANRPNFDASGFTKKVMDEMPHPNAFDGSSDGLNTGIYRWTRHRRGNDDISGATDDRTDRNQINIRIDHNFSQRHRLNVQWQYEKDLVDNSGPNWPSGFWGSVRRHPQVWTSNFVSTVSANIINEARWGLRRNDGIQYEAMDDPTYGAKARAFFPTYNGLPVLIAPGAGGTLGIGGRNFQSSLLSSNAFTRGNTTSLYTYADTLSWTKGTHAFKFGGEFRQDKSRGFSNLNLIPHATGGAGGGT